MDTFDPILDAVRRGDVGAVDQLLGTDPSLLGTRDRDGLSLVTVAQYHRHDAVVARLTRDARSLDIWEAAMVGDGAQLARILDADPALLESWSPDGYQPLTLAAYFGRLDAVRYLLGRGAPLTEASRNEMAAQPLNSAASGGHAEVCRVLLERGAEVNATSHGGFVALHSAAHNGDAALVSLLLEAGADPAAATDAGQTAEALATKAGHTAVAELLRAAQ